ncbi:hypothetical protein [Saccharopolyspora spinosa]|uniref:Osmoprotectant transport system permease protein n=1 Tax=Saccharopolyspora spinosa TaxID=60894 RepID=A0A2N3XS76_SACSN|nr:hypothetical protein [Saccharopolyspora spinosa]PKW13534.1 osmoprotectant transport system permease protein [Saccharopolyspora spinosa]
MNFLEYVASRWQSLLVDSYQHASMMVQCIVLATIIGVLVGVVVYRSPAGAAIATAASSDPDHPVVRPVCPGWSSRAW